jgi:hypothetical protein
MYVRKIKKAGKTYLYYYKSQRIGDKVKSIYVGRALERPKKETVKKDITIKPVKSSSMINNLIEFDNLLFEINRLITLKDLKKSINVYNEMFEIYSKINLGVEDKQKIFNKLDSTYKELVDLSKEHNIELLE